jgi:hypothetical protein
MDDLGRWRFAPAETRCWLADRALLLRTPGHRRGFRGRGPDRPVPCRAAVSNFTAEPFAGTVELTLSDPDGFVRTERTARLACAPGDVAEARLPLPLPSVRRPTRLRAALAASGAEPASWDLWAFPDPTPWPAGVVRLAGHPFTAAERAPDDVERAYSRGYGLPVRRWRPLLQHPGRLAATLPAWDGDGKPPARARVVLAHRLTRSAARFMEQGGRVVLLASKAAGGLGATYESMYGQVPMVVEEGPLSAGDGDWIVDMLVFDLMRRTCRVIPVGDMGIADAVDPLVRLVFTHDQPPVRLADTLLMTRVGPGLLIASSLDHVDAPGRHLLHRLVSYAVRDDATTRAAIDPRRLETCAD